ncbi:MAG: hypothetical protein RLZZ58_1100, partial [Pseudomonadota bacterium]
MTIDTAQQTIAANGIDICYQDHGDPAHPVILLIMGLGGQLTLWPVELVDALVAKGFRVVRYDNRDIGLSTTFDAAGVPNVRRLALRSLFRMELRVPYRIADMARDAVGLLDALGIERAHIVGASMGGMIAQHVAASHGARVLSLTSVMSTSGNRRLPRPKKAAMALLFDRPTGGDPEAIIAFSKRAAKVIGSPAYPPDPERLDRRIRADFARSFRPQGLARQMAAIIADGDRRPLLRRITAPTLVIHGEADPLAPIAGGHDTAANIDDAAFLAIPGMGHDLPLALVDTMA